MTSTNIIDWHMNPREQFDAFREELDFKPTEAARALGVPYHTFKDWQSGRRMIPSVAFRAIELLLLYPGTAKRLARKFGS